MYLIKTLLRNFRQKIVTNLINLLGLSVSLALVIFLLGYSYNELTTDNFHMNAENTYLYLPSANRIYTPGVLRESIENQIPGVESVVRIAGTWEIPVFQANLNAPINSDLLFADEDFFRMFTYKVVEGDPVYALKEPMNVVITRSLAEKLFAGGEALGQTIKLNNDKNLTVGAIIEEPKANSCLRFSAVTSIATQKNIQGESGAYTEWGWCDFQTFVLINKRIRPAEAEKSILRIIPPDFQKEYTEARLLPLKKVYFTKFLLYGSKYLVNGDITKVRVLLFVAILVLLIALINFITITTVQWNERLRQIGIMKIAGAGKGIILANLFAETLLFFIIASIAAMVILHLFIPGFGSAGITFNQELINSPRSFLLFSVSIIFLSTLFTLIPGLRLSSSKPIDNLKKTLAFDKNKFSYNGSFIVFQFSVAIILIAFTLLISKQIKFGRTNLGYKNENIVGIKLTPQLDSKKVVIKELLSKRPDVDEISFTQFYPGNENSSWRAQMNLDGEEKQLDFDTFSADAGFFKILGLKLAAGQVYDYERTPDNTKVIVNETFLHNYNIKDPLGKKITMGKRNFEIEGVIKDFHHASFSYPVAPLMIRNDPNASYCIVSLKGSQKKASSDFIGSVKKSFSDLSPSFPVEMRILSQSVNEMYKPEIQFLRVFFIFSGCAIIISCFGILALSLFAFQRRLKEIGIRKVNGARTADILVILNRQFALWLAVAFLIACPIAFFTMRIWLEQFAFKTDIDLLLFILSALIAFSVAMLTVSLQSFKTAMRNPVDILRYE